MLLNDLFYTLSGTPVQNNMRELFGLMNLLDNEKYANEDDFFESFGGDKEAITLPQVQALQVSLYQLQSTRSLCRLCLSTENNHGRNTRIPKQKLNNECLPGHSVLSSSALLSTSQTT